MKIFRKQQRQQDKKLYRQNVDLMINANHQVVQLLALLSNNFGEQFDEFNVDIRPAIDNAVRHMDNMTVVLKNIKNPPK